MKRANNTPDMTHQIEAGRWRSAFGLATPDESIGTLCLQETLLEEEYIELFEAIYDEAYSHTAEDKAHVLKELADLVFVAYQYAAVRGWNLDLALTRVFESNMSKLDVDGKPFRREDGKVTKGPAYIEADLRDLIP